MFLGIPGEKTKPTSLIPLNKKTQLMEPKQALELISFIFKI